METGEIARQSGGAVIVNVDDTVVMGTVVAARSAKAGQNFFPLTVDYIEKTYAAGKIPGGFFRRCADHGGVFVPRGLRLRRHQSLG